MKILIGFNYFFFSHFYPSLGRTKLYNFYIVLCRIRCQLIVIKMGEEEEMATQKFFFSWNILLAHYYKNNMFAISPVIRGCKGSL